MAECVSVRPQLLAASIISVLANAAAFAAGAPPKELGKISVSADEETYKSDVVSSPKYTQPLLDIPQTITVIPAAVIKDQGATSLRDVLRNSPGITFQAGEGGGGLPGDQNFSMRGFSSRNSLFIDGVRDIGAYTRDAFNLEQVEVIKGPTGAVAGRSTTSGAINQVTKTPHEGNSQEFSLGYGTDNFKRATGDLNFGLNDSMALRLNAMYHDAEVSNRDVVENKRWGFAPSFALGLGGSTRFTLSYLYVDEDNVPDYGLPWGTTPLVQTTAADPSHNGTFTTGAYNASPRVDQSNFYGLRDYDFEDVSTQSATAQIEHDFNATTRIRHVLRFIDSDRDSAITAPRPPNRQLHRRSLDAQNITNLTDLNIEFATGPVRHTLVTGLEFSREDTDNRNSADSTMQPPILDFYSPDPNERPLGAMLPNTGDPASTRTDNIALYVLDTIALNERWMFAAGVRRDDSDIEYFQRDYDTGEVLADLSKSEAEVTWNAAVIFKPAENSSLYVSYGTGFDPTVDAGAVGPGLSKSPTSANNVNLDPEESTNVELGTKWELLDARLALSAALFRMEKSNVRTRSGSDPLVLLGEQRVDGIELGASGMISEVWSIFAGAVYLDSEYEQSLNAIELGQELLLTPDLSASLWTTYLLPFGVTVGVGAQYTDDLVRARTLTGGEYVVPDRVLIDAMASYTINDAISLRLNATNLGDENYVDRFGGGHYVPGAGRTVSLTANFGF